MLNTYYSASVAQYTGNSNVFSGSNDEYLKRKSLIRVYAVQATTNGKLSVNIGGAQVMDKQIFYANGASAAQLPNRRDHLVGQWIGNAGDRVVLAIDTVAGAATYVGILYEVIPVA